VLLSAAAAAMLILLGLAPLGNQARGVTPVCPRGYLCVFEDANYGGQVVKFHRLGLSNRLADKMDDAASSVMNRRGGVSYLYEDPDGGGGSFCLEPHQSSTYVGDQFNDVASSTRLTKKNHCPV